ncbi:glycoside hydrolase superfamily [Colletotrichum navitas]|uniref:Glycoside hydrolase superfamily n=1 Tax=Colletotrichum navitas TaxID=681940 RepID=A0AAD8PIQ4_9PEZI|nr:glycoside hydrolase superfamily [Colletotrichum navitas]KAK1564007.1 glycoside hydrolase superfamily [Colletotrichum navitas]
MARSIIPGLNETVQTRAASEGLLETAAATGYCGVPQYNFDMCNTDLGRVTIYTSIPGAGEHVVANRERVSINSDWKFNRFTSPPDDLSYHDKLRPWILPTANDFIFNSDRYQRPDGQAPGKNVSYTQASFDDSAWESVNLPHDWAIKGPFKAPGIIGIMGSLPINGVGWYRRNLIFSRDDVNKSIYLDIDGAMAYAAVWLNGELIGGWPFGYASFRLDLTPYVDLDSVNQLAIRLENDVNSSRWYSGAGLYRSVWLMKTDPIHVANHGTKITTPFVSAEEATIDLTVTVESESETEQEIFVETEVKAKGRDVVGTFERTSLLVPPGGKASINGSLTLDSPLLWGPPPDQTPKLYVAVTTLSTKDGTSIDQYETTFGIRSLVFDPNQGVLVNGKKVPIHGVNSHHDLGSLGAAFNIRAAERQLKELQEMGCNSLRTAHNPPAPELLDLADRLGFLVLAEAFDAWDEAKMANDFHLIFPDWHEADLRSFIRRDFNHPSIVSWSIGNEIPEQRTAAVGERGQLLYDIVHEEDGTRPVTASLYNAQAGDPLANVIDIKSLNYQGEGGGGNYMPVFPSYRDAYPDSLIWSTESAATISTRGAYLFPVATNITAVIEEGVGISTSLEVSAYDLYHLNWSASPDYVFYEQDTHPYVAGEFVWAGWDYLGEPTPFLYQEDARSSYFGIIDLAGFRKDRFYLYQARWRPDLPSAHMLPHWSWGPEREGEITPVHVFTSADEAELFVNGESAGRVSREPYSWRLRWNNAIYVVTYKDGSVWAEATTNTTGPAACLTLNADRSAISADGSDLSFITVSVVDEEGQVVPTADDSITFSITGPGEIVATDNGSPIDQTPFPSLTRNAMSGLALAIVRSINGDAGEIVVTATAKGLREATVTVNAE